jgi:hypothetical protein
MYSEELFQTFYVGVQAIYDEYMEKHYPTLKKEVFKYSEGKRYIKVIRGGSVHLFVDKTNGDVLKAASWNIPAKGARGNLSDEHNGLRRVTPHGTEYNK